MLGVPIVSSLLDSVPPELRQMTYERLLDSSVI
jgi:hypothetical protein